MGTDKNGCLYVVTFVLFKAPKMTAKHNDLANFDDIPSFF